MLHDTPRASYKVYGNKRLAMDRADLVALADKLSKEGEPPQAFVTLNELNDQELVNTITKIG